jgi:dienelactone hydrolase
MGNLGRGLVVLGLVVGAGCGSKREPAKETHDAKAKPAADAGATATPTREVWSATLILVNELRDLVITFERTGDAWTASMLVPSVTKKTLPLSDVHLEPERIAFTLEKPGLPETAWEHYELTRAKDAGEASGMLSGAVVIEMARLGAGEAPHSVVRRPQTPQPPFPYQARDVVVDAPDGGKLAGTLTVPEGTGPFPAVLLISGSGQQDRDENIYGHRPYLILADRLTRDGFVTLRLDNRGTGKTTGDLGTLDTEIDDGVASVAFLKAQPEVDAARIGLIGHSTGGMVAPHVAVKTHAIAFIVSLAGPSVTGAELVPLQLEIAGRAAGTPEDELQKALEQQRKVSAAAVRGEAKAALTEMATAEMAAGLGREPTAAEVEAAIAQPLAEVTAPWTLSFFRLDPRAAWRQLEIPVLFVVGEKDTQVPADVNVKTLEESVTKPTLLTAKKLPGLNHLFQHAGSGFQDEYGTIEETFDPATLDVIATWLHEQATVGLDKPE